MVTFNSSGKIYYNGKEVGEYLPVSDSDYGDEYFRVTYRKNAEVSYVKHCSTLELAEIWVSEHIINDTTRLIKQTQIAIVDTMLKRIRGRAVKDIENGKIPDDWDTKFLGEYLSYITTWQDMGYDPLTDDERLKLQRDIVNNDL